MESRRKVLIVEDDPVVREILSAAVTRLGHLSLLSPNGRHALETVQCDPEVALIVTDVAMPEMNGRELIKAVRSLPRKGLPIPIIVMSGVVGPREIADVLKEGADAFLIKPIHLDQFREYVSRGLRETPSGSFNVSGIARGILPV